MSDAPNPAPVADVPADNPAPESVESSEEVLADGPEGESSEEQSNAELKKEIKKAKEEAKKKWKLKVGGKDVEIDDEEELVRRAQMGFSANEKWQEAARIKKETEAFFKFLMENPGDALSQLGLDVDNLAESHLQRRIEEMQKSPEQLEREKLQKELEDLRKKDKEREEKLKQAEMERLQDHYAVEIENSIMSALDNSKTLPKKPYVVKRVADALLLAMDNGFNDVSVDDVLPLVEKEIKSEIQEMMGVMPEDIVEAFIGKEVLGKIRKNRVNKVKAPQPLKEAVKQTGASEMPKEEKSKEKMKARDFFKTLGTYKS